MTIHFLRPLATVCAGLPLLVLGGLRQSAAASPAQSAAAAGTGQAVVMELSAVTLLLQCHGEAIEGQFHPVAAKVLDAATWAAGPQARADANGYFAPGRAGKGKKANRPRKQAQAKAAAGAVGVLVTLKPEGDATLEVKTPAGTAAIRLQEVEFDAPKTYLDGAMSVRRLPAATRFAAAPTDNDYPAAAAGPKGDLWVAYVAYRRGGEPDMAAAAKGDFRSFQPKGNGDQICLIHFDGKQWSAPKPVTEPLLDLWKPTVAVAGGQVWVAWSQNVGGNWDIYRRRYNPADDQWSAIERMTSDPGSDINAVSATDATGKVWWAWQGRRGKFFQIFLTSEGGSPIAVTQDPANHWDPAVAADHQGSIYVAWDSYGAGNYDVFMQRFRSGQSGPVIPVATSSNFETRASLAVDGKDRVWIGYEMGGPNWAKDFGRVVPKSSATPQDVKKLGKGGKRPEGGDGVGIPMYLDRRVVVRCYADDRLQQPAADPASAWGDLPRPKSFARIMPAADGRVWLLFRHHPLPGGARETWAEYAMSYDGKAWSKPQLLADSDNILDNRPTLAPFGPDGVMAVYSSDWRLRGASNGVAGGRLPLKNDLYASLLRGGSPLAGLELAAASPGSATVKPVHPQEAQDIQRLRDFKVNSGGKTYQLVRGEFHRHTEYTAHRDGDGSLEDMWRYSQDAADMDWLGNADHDNGFGHQYPWWTIQKTMDIYQNPPWFIAPYTYERSVSWPNGHRNVMFAQRGVRTLPRGDMKGDPRTGTPDTKMLYAYLQQFGGICASHTSATSMGTDWRDNNRLLEPVVEIYQGDRNNYECDDAPRAPAARRGGKAGTEAIHSQGFIWNALAKGYRLGFESSSDHISTHASYGIALVEKPGREALLDAFRARRCYAATDNIGLVVTCAGHLMGEEFPAAAAPTLEIRVLSTAPVAKVDIVRNNRYVYSAAPNRANVELRWTDVDPPAQGVSYYYVRIQQADGNLAWSSPMWIHR